MKVLKFNESYGDPDIIKKALFCSGDGSGYYELCGQINQSEPDELKNADAITYFRFKNFSFVMAETIKEVDSHAGSDEVIWSNNWGHLMHYNKEKHNFIGVNIHNMSYYRPIAEKFPDFKLELLPYFFKESGKDDVINWFNELTETNPDEIQGIIKYTKTSGVYRAYDALKEYLMPLFKFAHYWEEELPKDVRDVAKDMGDLGFK
jgi:hypothetical protein